MKVFDNCESDNPLPKIITSDWGVGVTFKDDKGIEYTTIPNRHGEVRTLYGDISTWKGISGGATHYYGKIYTYDLELSYIENGVNRISSISGYFSRFKPIECKSIDLELVREITEEEIEENPRMWEYYHAGDDTTRFNTFEEVVELMKKIFKKHFKGNWNFELKGPYGRKFDVIKKRSKKFA